MGTSLKRHSRPTQIERMQPQHRAIARAYAGGMTQAEIATRFGLTASWVCQICNSPLFKVEVARLTQGIEEDLIENRQTIERDLDSLLGRATEVIAEDLYADTPSGRRTDVAFKILDRRGYHPKQDQPKGDDNRQINYITLAPMPGEDPAEAIKRVKDFLGDDDESLGTQVEPSEKEESKWEEGTYELGRADEEVEGRKVYQLQLAVDSEDSIPNKGM